MRDKLFSIVLKIGLLLFLIKIDSFSQGEIENKKFDLSKTLERVDAFWKNFDGELSTSFSLFQSSLRHPNTYEYFIDPAALPYPFTSSAATDPKLSFSNALRIKPIKNWELTFSVVVQPDDGRASVRLFNPGVSYGSPSTLATEPLGDLARSSALNASLELTTSIGDSLNINLSATSIENLTKIGSIDIPKNGGKNISVDSGVAQGVDLNKSFRYTSKQIAFAIVPLKTLTVEPRLSVSLLYKNIEYPNNFPAGPFRDPSYPASPLNFWGYTTQKLIPEGNASIKVRVRPTFWFQIGGGFEATPDGYLPVQFGFPTLRVYNAFAFVNSELKFNSRLTITGAYRLDSTLYDGSTAGFSTSPNTVTYDTEIQKTLPQSFQALAAKLIDQSGVTIGFRFR
jgi:hypothetical protein